MWKCNNCNKNFNSPKELNTTYESYYGVGGEFGSRTPMTLLICPNCRDENIEEVVEDEEQEEEE